MTVIEKIKQENNPKNTIIKYMKEYSEKTGRNCILYSSEFLTKPSEVTNIDLSDKLGFITVIESLDKSKGLDLILHTPGGSLDATESIIDYLHATFGDDIRAVIPQLAMSSGTMIACSCKEILMANHSSLGPVDPQIIDIAAKNVKKEFDLAKKEIREDPDSIPYWSILLEKYPINFSIECENAIEWSKYILEKSLRYSMFKNNDKDKIEKIKHELITSDYIKDHTQNFSAEKCREIGLKIKNLEDDKKLHEIVLSIHYASISYFNLKKTSKILANQKGIIQSYYSNE